MFSNAMSSVQRKPEIRLSFLHQRSFGCFGQDCDLSVITMALYGLPESEHKVQRQADLVGMLLLIVCKRSGSGREWVELWVRQLVELCEYKRKSVLHPVEDWRRFSCPPHPSHSHTSEQQGRSEGKNCWKKHEQKILPVCSVAELTLL